MAVIYSITIADVYIENQDHFPIPSIVNWFVGDGVVFQGDNASRHRTKRIKAFQQVKSMKSITWQDWNQIEIYGGIFIVHEKILPIKEDLLTAILEKCKILIKNIDLNKWNPYLNELRLS